MSGLLWPGQLRDELRAFCASIEKQRSRQFAIVGLNGIASRFEHGAQRSVEDVLRLESRIRRSEDLSPFQVGRHAVVAAAGICTLTEAERVADLADAVGRRDVARCVEHRLAWPGVETDLALLHATEGVQVVERALSNLRSVAEARDLLDRFRRAFVAVQDPLSDFDLLGLRVSLDEPGDLKIDPFWPPWSVPKELAR